MTIEQFCTADALGEWEQRQQLDGFVILQFPRLAMFCSPHGYCIAIAVKGTDLSTYFEEATFDEVA